MTKPRRRLAWIKWAALGVYVAYMAFAVAVAYDPTGIGGEGDPDGLEGVPLILGLFVGVALVGGWLVFWLGNFIERRSRRGN